jgi:mercuric ion binding protein
MKITVMILISFLFSQALLAAPQTVQLAIEHMTCAMCPITVKVSLNKVPGVSQVSISFETKIAEVTFDNSQTSVENLTKATTNAGYPSSLIKK